jgi:DNA-binding response OmpR family regulator
MNATSRSRPAVPLLRSPPQRGAPTRGWRVTLLGARLVADKTLRRHLDAEYDVLAYSRAREALASMEDEHDKADVVAVEQTLADGMGVDFLRELRVRYPDTVRVLILDSADSEVVQQAVNDAAVYQVVIAPWQPESLHLLVRRALESRELARIHRYLSRELKFADSVVNRQNESMQSALQEVYSFDRMVFVSNAMAEVCNLARKAAATDLPVLIEGETGTGKELMARAIHLFSQRHKLLFMAENCGATTICCRANSSAIGAAPSPARPPIASASSRRPMAAPSSSTRSPRSRPACRSASCASCRKARCGRSAATRRGIATCASSPPAIDRCASSWPTASSARTCTTACAASRCASRRCANGARTSRRSSRTCSTSTRVRCRGASPV